jgi:hypothetical protein
MIAAVGDSGGQVDERTRDLVRESLLSKQTLDLKVLEPLHPPPPPTSFFTTLVADKTTFRLDSRPFHGEIFLATKPDDDVQYAIKRQEVQAGSDTIPRNLLSFFREVFTQVYASHPAVLPLCGWNIYAGGGSVELFQVSKYAANGVLDITRVSAMSATQKQIIMYGIARGMSYLHSLKILHRGLKPSSIFLDEQNWPLVAGMGFAKYGGDLAQSVAFTGAETYTAPEVLQGEYGLPADIFSCAMIYYEIVEGRSSAVKRPDDRPPFNSATNCQRELIEAMWSGEAYERMAFSDVVVALTNWEFWFAGVDPGEFARYKGYLDTNEPTEADTHIVLADWVTKASQLQAVTARAESVNGGVEEMLINVVAFLTTSSPQQDVLLMTLLRESFRTRGCIDP